MVDAAESRLRRWRSKSGFTLQDVSDLTGVSTAMLSRLERRQRRIAPGRKVAMARALGVRVGELFEPEMAQATEAEA